MHLDVTDIRAFYETPLGQVARRLVRRRLRTLWPDARGRRLLGLGYAIPYLRPYLGEAERVLAFMPAGQGAAPWPRNDPGLTALVEEADLPLPDESVDLVLMVHALETGEAVRPMLREIWRVLSPGGRILIVAPNRRGLWARNEATPFGHGHPYSRSQLQGLLRDQMFTPVQWDTALHLWPARAPLALRWSAPIDRMGARWLPRFAGVHLVEASKQIYGLPLEPAARRVRRRLAVLAGAQSALSTRAAKAAISAVQPPSDPKDRAVASARSP